MSTGPTQSINVHVERGRWTCAEAIDTVEEYLGSIAEGQGQYSFLDLGNGLTCFAPTAVRATTTGNAVACETQDRSERIVGRPAGSYVLAGSQVDPERYATGNSSTPYKFVTADGNTECSTSSVGEDVEMFCLTGKSSGALQYGSISPGTEPTSGSFKYEPGMPVFNGEGVILPAGKVFVTEGVTCRAEDAATLHCTSPSGEVTLDGRSVTVS